MADAAPVQTAASVLQTSSAPAAAPPAAVSPPPASGSPVTAAPAATSPAVAAANAAWYGDLGANAELKAWAENKQFKDAATTFESYKNLEKLVGAPADQLIRKPKDANDAEGMKAFRTALGVPEAAEAYEIQSPDGPAGADFVKWAGSTFLDAGIPKEAAGKIVAKWNEFATAQLAGMEQASQAAFASGMVQLKDQWGAAASERLELAARAAKMFGPALGMKEIGDNVFKSLEKGAGDGVTLIKFLAEVGARLSEDKFVGGAPQAFTMTAEQANAKIKELQGDRAWTSAYLSGDKNKQAEMQKLQEISVGTAK